MLFWITCRLTTSLAEHDPDIKGFVESSYLSKTVALQLFGNESKGDLGWTFNASDLERPKIEVSIEHFQNDPPVQYDKMNTLILYWPGLCPRVVLDCVASMRSGTVIWENCISNDILCRFPIDILVLDYTEIFFPLTKRFNGVPPKAFRRIRSRFSN